MKPVINWASFNPVGSEAEYLADALSSGWVSGGTYVNGLEESIESVFKGARALSVSNGTAALQLALATLDAKTGDEVIVPAFCFQAAANVALQLGLHPVYCDVDMNTWNQSLETVEEAYSDRTVGIVIVHNYGVAAPSKEICEWAAAKGLWVIEDCAEAWFSQIDSEYVGLHGDIATFSMHAAKTIACGEGGIVLINRQDLVDRATLLRSQGLDRSSRHYYHKLPGHNFRLSNLLCAVALAQFEARAEILEAQRQRSDLYLELLADHPNIELQQGLGGNFVDERWACAVRVDFEELRVTRDGAMGILGERGIEVRPGFYSASSLPYTSPEQIVSSKNADYLAENAIVLPTNVSVSEGDVRRVCDELTSLIATNK